MRFLITRTCQGVMDTKYERLRIQKAFRGDRENRRRLMLLMDAIEAGKWEKANQMLESKWWRGRDKKLECPRTEFIGMLLLQNPTKGRLPAYGFDCWMGYSALIEVMSSKKPSGGIDYKVELLEEEV